MQNEVEIKVKINNRKSLLKKIKILGASLVNKSHHVDIYYSPIKGKRFIGNNKKLRVRKNLTNDTARFEYHVPRSKYSGDEHEVPIDNGDMMDCILHHLKFREEARIDKIRTRYQYKDFNIDIDEVKKLGTYMEIELMNISNKKKGVNRIKQLLSDLGVAHNSIVNDRYLDIYLNKIK